MVYLRPHGSLAISLGCRQGLRHVSLTNAPLGMMCQGSGTKTEARSRITICRTLRGSNFDLLGMDRNHDRLRDAVPKTPFLVGCATEVNVLYSFTRSTTKA